MIFVMKNGEKLQIVRETQSRVKTVGDKEVKKERKKERNSGSQGSLRTQGSQRAATNLAGNSNPDSVTTSNAAGHRSSYTYEAGRGQVTLSSNRGDPQRENTNFA